jgi:hypothetical protein
LALWLAVAAGVVVAEVCEQTLWGARHGWREAMRDNRKDWRSIRRSIDRIW